jgi:hypothetical protein
MILRAFHEGGGRFLKRDKTKERWNELNEKEAREKVRAALKGKWTFDSECIPCDWEPSDEDYATWSDAEFGLDNEPVPAGFVEVIGSLETNDMVLDRGRKSSLEALSIIP